MNLFFVFLLSYWLPYFHNDIGAFTSSTGGFSTGGEYNVEQTFNNPASLTNFSGKKGILSFNYTEGEHYTTFFGEDTTLVYISNDFFPSLAGFTFSLNDRIGLGFSYSLPYKMERHSNWIKERTGESPEGTGREYRYIERKRFHSLNSGVGWKCNDNFSLGINLSFLLVKYKSGFEYDDGTDNTIPGTLYGIKPSLGFQCFIGENVTAGFIISKGYAKGGYERTYYEYSGGDSVAEITKYYWEKETLPLFVSVGIGYEITDRIRIFNSIDYTRWGDISYDAEKYAYILEDLENEIRLHEGFEFRITPATSIYMGLHNEPYQYSTTKSSLDQIFITAGFGFKVKGIKVNLSAASSRLIKAALKRENRYYITVTYE